MSRQGLTSLGNELFCSSAILLYFLLGGIAFEIQEWLVLPKNMCIGCDERKRPQKVPPVYQKLFIGWWLVLPKRCAHCTGCDSPQGDVRKRPSRRVRASALPPATGKFKTFSLGQKNCHWQGESLKKSLGPKSSATGQEKTFSPGPKIPATGKEIVETFSFDPKKSTKPKVTCQ